MKDLKDLNLLDRFLFAEAMEDPQNMRCLLYTSSDFTNTKSGMAEAATDDANFSSEFLGGQNPFAYFAPVAENIKIAPLSAYDQGCVEPVSYTHLGKNF